jgi:hypothetical protein
MSCLPYPLHVHPHNTKYNILFFSSAAKVMSVPMNNICSWAVLPFASFQKDIHHGYRWALYKCPGMFSCDHSAIPGQCSDDTLCAAVAINSTQCVSRLNPTARRLKCLWKWGLPYWIPNRRDWVHLHSSVVPGILCGRPSVRMRLFRVRTVVIVSSLCRLMTTSTNHLKLSWWDWG